MADPAAGVRSPAAAPNLAAAGDNLEEGHSPHPIDLVAAASSTPWTWPLVLIRVARAFAQTALGQARCQAFPAEVDSGHCAHDVTLWGSLTAL